MRLSLYLTVFLLLASCREEFQLEAEFEDIPVIFAYLDPTEPEQYVRVQRVVQGGGADAGAVAMDAERLFYDPEAATVSLTNLQTRESVELERVDGNELGLEREDGVFAGDPNVLYRLPGPNLNLRPGSPIQISVARDDEFEATAETTLLESIEIIRPTTTVRIDDYRRPLLLSWEAGPNAAVFSVEFIFHIREFYAADPSRDRELNLRYPLDLSYQPGNNDRSGNLIRYEVDNEAVYRFIGDALPVDDGVVRRLDDFDVRITAAGVEVARLLALENANAGLTSSQAVPRYTNVVGGQGIVTSRVSELRGGVLFDDGSLDSLREGRFTQRLNFR
jgi:hypothetical protein